MAEDRATIKDFADLLDQLETETDRGAALTAAALMDEFLLQILEAFLVENKATTELLSGGLAPLGNYANRARAAYALGLISEYEYGLLVLTGKIRNAFGHRWKNIDFNTPEIADRISHLPYKPTLLTGEQPENRERFITASCYLLSDLLSRIPYSTAIQNYPFEDENDSPPQMLPTLTKP